LVIAGKCLGMPAAGGLFDYQVLQRHAFSGDGQKFRNKGDARSIRNMGPVPVGQNQARNIVVVFACSYPEGTVIFNTYGDQLAGFVCSAFGLDPHDIGIFFFIESESVESIPKPISASSWNIGINILELRGEGYIGSRLVTMGQVFVQAIVSI